MTRVARRCQWTTGACYHVFNRGHNRDILFPDDQSRFIFLDLLQRYQQRFGLRWYHDCLMDNHFHLFLQLPDARQLSPCMAGFGRSDVHAYHRQFGFVGHLFQGRFNSPAIDAEIYVLSCGRYIERNPLEAGLVAEPWTYRWSSCRVDALGEPDPLLTANPWYEELAATGERRQELWREFLLGEDAKEEAVRRAEGVLGSDEFRSDCRRARARVVPGGRGRRRKQRA
jgi:putative transposase